MGNPLGPLLANIFMSHVEKLLCIFVSRVEKLLDKPKFKILIKNTYRPVPLLARSCCFNSNLKQEVNFWVRYVDDVLLSLTIKVNPIILIII